MALILLLASALAAQPAQLVLGKDAGADLDVSAPPGAKVTFSSSVGTVGAPQPHDGGVRARFTPPPLRAPTVALVLAEIEANGERELQWLSIPLSGSDFMEIETRPGSEVRALVAGRTIGPASADKNGVVKLPMVVPPGVRQGTLLITDKLGNSSEKPLDLDPPPFSRIRMASRHRSASSATPAEVEVFVVKPDGSPDDEARVEVTSAAGGDTERRGRVAPGVYLVEYTAPEGRKGPVELTAKASGQLATMELEVRPPAPGEHRSSWRSALSPSPPWSISAGLFAGGGATWNGAGAGTFLAEGALRLGELPLEATLDLGGSFFGTVQQYAAIPSLAEKAKAHAWLAQVGLRASRQIAGRWDAYASLAFGLQNQIVNRTFPGNLGTASDSEVAPRLAFALGAATRLGPGRAFAQIQLDAVPHGVANYAGTTGGLAAMVGYLLTLR
ncbi:MAG TPA: hypothetical protein VFE90_19865 [Myxococcales bacterium]|nr:hypothetical protein [Myxococcales bacterium]